MSPQLRFEDLAEDEVLQKRHIAMRITPFSAILFRFHNWLPPSGDTKN
jgi:hypothetical protein